MKDTTNTHINLLPAETVAIIPAAGSKGGAQCSDAMITVAGKPAIFWTIRGLISEGVREICIVVGQRENDLERFVKLVYEGLADLTFIVPDRLAGVGYSVACGVMATKTWRRPLLVVLGDTILDTLDLDFIDSSWVAVSEVDDQKRWCLAEIDNGRVISLYDKPKIKVPAKHACTGLYFFRDGLEIDSQSIEGIVAQKSVLEMIDFLHPLAQSGRLYAQKTTHWLDVGNPDHLQEARQRLIQSRSFNSLDLDPLRGTITKRSSYKSKFHDEINYFKLLPSELSTYFPRIIDSSVAPGLEYLKMEYYAYPTLADLFLFEELPIGFWRKAFHRLKCICDDFSTFDYGLAYGDAADIYVKKNIERFESFLLNAPTLAQDFINSKEHRINGLPVPSPRVVIERSRRRLTDLINRVRWTPIHGDLCLSNILCEPNSCLIKLLDPRGSFGQKGFLGDIRYDIAKLAHSVIGRYDFIVNDLYRLRHNEGNLVLEFPLRKDMDPIVAEFESTFLAREDKSDIVLITAWLFLSMLPLHSDHPKRQLAMLAVGLRLFSSLPEQ